MEHAMNSDTKNTLADIGLKCGIMSVCVAILAITIGSPLYLGNKIENLRRDFHQDMNVFQGEMKQFRETWAKESKDFHGRLCIIEERNKK